MGSHTYDKIAELLDSINSDFDISYKNIVATVTDNASNFCKAFKTYNVTMPVEQDTEELDEDDLEFLSPCPPAEYTGDEDRDRIHLSNHVRCASHTLNLVATTDAANAIKASPALAKINHSAMGKCSALWSCSGRPKSSEVIKEKLGCHLKYPCATRWNSLFDSVTAILAHKTTINEVMKALSLPVFKESEMEFLQEYSDTLKPIAVALDMLQSEKENFWGELIPTLLITAAKFDHIEVNDLRLRHCMPVLAAVASGFKRRFASHLQLDVEVTDATLASVSHPFFKMSWISLVKDSEIDTLKSSIRSKFIAAANKFSADFESSTEISPEMPASNNFWSQLDRSNSSSSKDNNSAEMQAIRYLQDSRVDLASLHDYPAVKKFFMRYNTCLTSSAPVERLFSFAGMIHNPKRTSLTDSMFEALLLMKTNRFCL